MKLNKKILSFIAISTICIGCDNSNNSSSNSNNNLKEKLAKVEISNSQNNGRVINPENVILEETLYTIENKKLQNLQVLPSTGDVNILVIPILLPDYKVIDINNDGKDDSYDILTDINDAFFGEKNHKFESVKSFYKKSSYGKLNIGGEVTEWFDVEEWTDYKTASSIDAPQTYDLVREAVNWAKNIMKIDMSKYDNDRDGYIDGVWCIYSAPNLKNGGPQTDYGNYWAYTSWGNQDNSIEKPNVNNPIYNLFGWASYDFMYDGYGIEHIDAHTYIHETGHFLGLNDYYSDNMSYNPIGKIDMMDGNVTDLNSYSKMLLGWTKPYLVTGNASIDLKTMHNENSLIVIPSDSVTIKDNKFDPFSEYILIEYYTNEALNNSDSINEYSNGFQAPQSNGVRIYHVDNRKFIADATNEYNMTCKEYQGETLTKTKKLVLPITNKRGMDNYNFYFNLDINVNLYDEIRMIEATNIDTFSSGGIQKEKSLFKQNDEFSLDKYGENFFINKNKFNNGDSFSYKIKIGEVI